MNSKFIFLLVIFLSIKISANALETEWNEGVIVLTSGDVLKGDLNYNYNWDVVQLKSERGIKAYSSHNVKSFRFYDKRLNVLRRFQVLKLKTHIYKRKKMFFEIVLSGSISLIRRKNPYTSQNDNQGNYYPTDIYSNYIMGYKYFYYQNEELIDLRKFRKKILPVLMDNYDHEVKNFVHAHKLKLFKIRDQIITVDYYNSLRDKRYSSIHTKFITMK